jgi:DNA modification methylase
VCFFLLQDGSQFDDLKIALEGELSRNPYSDVISCPRTVQAHKFKDTKDNAVPCNPYQKPLRLYLQLLKMFVLPQSSVFDGTCGSGSLELAAMEVSAPHDLTFYSYDKNKYQCDNAMSRWSESCLVPKFDHKIMVDVAMEKAVSET